MRKFIAFVLAALFLALPTFAPPAHAAGEPLNHASLKPLLDGLGYEAVEKTFRDTGGKFWQVSFPKGSWTYIVAFNANNKDAIWTSVEFGLYKGAPEEIPQSVLLGMLQENSKLAWSRFHYQPSTHSFFLISTIRNKDVSPADLRRVIEEIIAATDRTQKLWDPKQWPKSAAAEPAKAAPEASGDSKK